MMSGLQSYVAYVSKRKNTGYGVRLGVLIAPQSYTDTKEKNLSGGVSVLLQPESVTYRHAK